MTDGAGIFFDTPVATVVLEDAPEIDGYALRDLSGHVWLRLGTDSSGDEWYPWFVFQYTPSGAQHATAG